MKKTLINNIILLSILANSPHVLSKTKEANTKRSTASNQISDSIKDAEIGAGLVLLLTVIPGIFTVIGSGETILTCGKAAIKLNKQQRQELFEYLNFKQQQAIDSYQVICAKNKKNESVFVSHMQGKNIEQKILNTRFNYYYKCLNMINNKNKVNQPEPVSQISAVENIESEVAQKFFADVAFNGNKVECTTQTAAAAKAVIQERLRQYTLTFGTLFALLFRNNLATDPNAFIPEDSPLLKPINAEQFNKIEANQQK